MLVAGGCLEADGSVGGIARSLYYWACIISCGMKMGWRTAMEGIERTGIHILFNHSACMKYALPENYFLTM